MKYKYPCCGYYTFDEKPNENYDICEVCFCEDDPIQLENPTCKGETEWLVVLRKSQK